MNARVHRCFAPLPFISACGYAFVLISIPYELYGERSSFLKCHIGGAVQNSKKEWNKQQQQQKA